MPWIASEYRYAPWACAISARALRSTRRGFSLPVPDSQPGGPRAREYLVDYPVDPGFLRALDPAHGQVDHEFVVREVEIGGDLRRSLYAPAPAELVFPVSLRQSFLKN